MTGRAKRSSTGAALFCALLGLTGTGCSSNLGSFDTIYMAGRGRQGPFQINGTETAVQGAGRVSSVVGPGGHTIRRTAVGGTYLRSESVGDTLMLRSGLHAQKEGR